MKATRPRDATLGRRLPIPFGLVLLATAPIAGPTAAPPAWSPGTPDSTDEVTSLLERVAADAYEDAELVELTALVAVGEDILLDAGWARTASAPDGDTEFAAGPLASAFLAQTVLERLDAGALELDEVMAERFESWPYPEEPITLAQLLAHTSGLPSLDGLTAEDLADREAVFEHWTELPLESKPGRCARYSGSNDLVLAWILAEEAEVDVTDAIAAAVFEPFELGRTRFPDNGVPHETLTPWIQEFAGGHEHRETLPPFGTAQLVSTSHDLHRWLRTLLDQTLVSETTFKRMTEPPFLTDGTRSRYAAGFSTTTLADRDGFTAGGGAGNRRVHVACYPDKELILVVLARGSGPEPEQAPADWIERRLARAVFDLPDPEIHDYPLEPSECVPYLGDYMVGCTQYTIVVRDGRLHLSLPNGTYVGLAYQGRHVFVAHPDPILELRFELSDEGVAEAFLLAERGSETRAVRWR